MVTPLDNLAPCELWGHGGWCNQDVAGESHYVPALKGLFQWRGAKQEEFAATAALVPEPTNAKDPNAVMVQIAGMTVGYLPREVAPRYQGLLAHLMNDGFVANVPCRVWAASSTTTNWTAPGD